MNIYVSQLKDALKIYYNKQKEYNNKIEENNKKFSEEYSRKANEEVKQMQRTEYEHTQQIITDIYTSVRSLLAIASFPNVEQLTADRHIFESGIDLPVETVQAFVDRYTNPYNPTMLSYIKSWIDRQPHEKGKVFGKYDGIKIITPKEQLDAYKKFSVSALNITDKIYHNGNIMIQPLELDSFADESFASGLFSVIGDGMTLSNYKTARVPDSAKNIFNSETLSQGQNGAE